MRWRRAAAARNGTIRAVPASPRADDGVMRPTACASALTSCRSGRMTSSGAAIPSRTASSCASARRIDDERPAVGVLQHPARAGRRERRVQRHVPASGEQRARGSPHTRSPTGGRTPRSAASRPAAFAAASVAPSAAARSRSSRVGQRRRRRPRAPGDRACALDGAQEPGVKTRHLT